MALYLLQGSPQFRRSLRKIFLEWLLETLDPSLVLYFSFLEGLRTSYYRRVATKFNIYRVAIEEIQQHRGSKSA